MKRYNGTLPYPFARAVEANGFLFLSGQVAMSASGEPLHGSVDEQTRLIMSNIQETLKSCGSGIDKVVKVTVWLSDMKHFQTFNDAYRTSFPNGFPARTTVVSKLAFDLDVEIEVQALA
ncbi:RidA family protein [Pseudomonas sp. PA27(2017)]|uniref:RidA family protein n=1 Tax=Pseudomonas sp. PA27(2017) TaxID=1932112 RepID=UPI00095CFDDE|nr:RidA family protein [Pseudomonas sp. PA27(2017)]OLU26446.1 enamine deaminase RidA [Pseudomonas sp. PA27(2017)]